MGLDSSGVPGGFPLSPPVILGPTPNGLQLRSILLTMLRGPFEKHNREVLGSYFRARMGSSCFLSSLESEVCILIILNLHVSYLIRIYFGKSMVAAALRGQPQIF